MPYLFKDIPNDFGEGLVLTKEETELLELFKTPVFADHDIKTVCSEGRRITRKVRGAKV
jgi:hypothetical protein